MDTHNIDVPQETFIRTRFNDENSFWQKKRTLVAQTTVPLQLEILKKTGRYDAFKLGWNSQYSDPYDHPPVPNHLFWDSDVAKWIEAVCYFFEDGTLKTKGEVQAAVEDLVSMIQNAQQPDGYLNIHFTVVDPKGRFSNLRDLHELYNAGHLIEAALAENRWSGETGFLDTLTRYTSLLSSTFGSQPDQKHGYPGHPEIELALLRLYRRTRDEQHLELAKYFILERGNPTGQNGSHYYDVESEARSEGPDYMPSYYPAPKSYWYQQAHAPIMDQSTIEGHSVRAMYLLTAVADLILLTDGKTNKGLSNALHVLWDNMVDKKMYLTGAIGAIKKWEGFGPDYFLPQSTDEGGCYGETCAAIGVIMLAERLLKMDLDHRYADVLELSLYNALLGGISLDGKKFTYENQLASSEGEPSRRHDWFTCACCPPNVCRTFGYLGGFLWSTREDLSSREVAIDVHLYATATLNLGAQYDNVELSQKSDWPWNGEISFRLNNPKNRRLSIKLRIPQYVKDWSLTPAYPGSQLQKGYLLLENEYLREHQDFTLSLPLRPRLLQPHPNTKQNIVAFARGPVVYCAEDVDNDWVHDHFRSVKVDIHKALGGLREEWNSTVFEKEPFPELILSDAALSVAYVNGQEHDAASRPTSHGDTNTQKTMSANPLRLIPYYLRANRGGRGQMRVGFNVQEILLQ